MYQRTQMYRDIYIVLLAALCPPSRLRIFEYECWLLWICGCGSGMIAISGCSVIRGCSWSTCHLISEFCVLIRTIACPWQPNTVPGCHASFLWYMRAHTNKPGSYLITGAHAVDSPAFSSAMISNLDCNQHPSNNSAGLILVIAWGALQKANTNLDSFYWVVAPFMPPIIVHAPGTILRASFTVRTLRSACPLLFGWYGAVNLCLIPLALVKWQNSCAVNCGPLSDTMFQGGQSERILFVVYL